MSTPFERMQSAWSSGAPQALDREVEQLAREGYSQQSLEDALEGLLNRIRSQAGDDEREEIINGVWDRLTGWCHASQHIQALSANGAAPSVDGVRINNSAQVDSASR